MRATLSPPPLDRPVHTLTTASRAATHAEPSVRHIGRGLAQRPLPARVSELVAKVTYLVNALPVVTFSALV